MKTDSPASVVLFTDSDVFAGTERHMLDLARGLRGDNVPVLLACPRPSALGDRGEAEGFRVVPIAKGGLIDTSAIKTLRGLLQTGEAGVIHAHNGRTALSAAAAVRLAGAGCCVLTQHFLEPARAGRGGIAGLLYNAAHKWVSHNTSEFIAISEAVASEMRERGDAPNERIVVIPNGITEPDTGGASDADTAQLRRTLGVPDGGALIVCAARLEREKNVGALVDAFAFMSDAYPHAVCVVAGEGSERAALEARIGAQGLEKRVRLLGFRDDVPALIQAADLFVLPSLAEPFGLVLLEAMALRKPVIATNAGGPREIVAQDETGFLVTPNDSGALAGALVRLLADPVLAKRMGEAGRRRYEANFTAERMARQTCAVYERAASRERRPAHSTVPVTSQGNSAL